MIDPTMTPPTDPAITEALGREAIARIITDYGLVANDCRAATGQAALNVADTILASRTRLLDEVVEGLAIAQEAMTWADAHTGGTAKYESPRQVVSCLDRFEVALEKVRALLLKLKG